MNTHYHGWYLGLLLCLLVGETIVSNNATFAEVVPDATLGRESSVVTPVVVNGTPIEQINGGAVRGANLFHSFAQFNIGAGQAAYFTNPAGVDRIFSRVTGGSRSEILGTVGVLGTADLFLINPNGIIFGANAQLNVAGSFIGSTASGVKFADGTEFRATNPQNPLLTVSTPVGLQFGQTAGDILVQGQGQPLPISPGSLAPFQTEQEAIATFTNPEAIQVEAIALLTSLLSRPSGLQVPPGKTLALVGGNLNLESGHLTAKAGRVALGSVAQPALVSLTPTDVGWTLGYENVQNFGDINLLKQSSIDTTAGDTQIRAKNVTLANQSSLLAETFGIFNGKEINIQASQLNISGDSVVLTGTVGSGRGGDVNFQVERLNVADGSAAITGVLGDNQGGKLTINASEYTNVSGNSLLTTSSLGSGAGGDIAIQTGKLSIQDRGKIVSASAGSGNAGSLVVKATDSVEIGKNSFLTASTATNGNAGFLSVNTGNLIVTDGGNISNATSGSGNGGTLVLQAERVKLSNEALVTVGSLGTGTAGELIVSARSIELDNNAALTATTSSGNGGNINLQAKDLLLLRRGSNISTRAGTLETRSGTGGTISIDTANLVALNNSDIDANAFGGTGGQVKISAQGIFGTERREQQTPQSDITASSNLGANFSGRVELTTPNVDIRQGLVALPVEVVDASSQIAAGCANSTQAKTPNKFTMTGRGGLPRNPDDTLTDETVLTHWATLPQTEATSPAKISSKPQQPPQQIIEAQGWMVNPQGKLFLTAQAPDVTPSSNRFSTSACQKSPANAIANEH